jgi:DNA adenine methylase
MATNHNTKLIRELYKNFKIDSIKTNRSINSNGSLRKLTGDEVVIINY